MRSRPRAAPGPFASLGINRATIASSVSASAAVRVSSASSLDACRFGAGGVGAAAGGAGCAVTSAGVVADKAAAAPAACLNRFRRETARGAWRAAPALAAVLVARAVLEERTLAQELPGYRDYAARVRYRLPG